MVSRAFLIVEGGHVCLASNNCLVAAQSDAMTFIYNLARYDMKIKAIEKIFFYQISLLKLFSLLHNLVCVASVLNTQPRRKSKDWLARNYDNVFILSDMST
jgi:hypothetical protein